MASVREKWLPFQGLALAALCLSASLLCLFISLVLGKEAAIFLLSPLCQGLHGKEASSENQKREDLSEAWHRSDNVFGSQSFKYYLKSS